MSCMAIMASEHFQKVTFAPISMVTESENFENVAFLSISMTTQHFGGKNVFSRSDQHWQSKRSKVFNFHFETFLHKRRSRIEMLLETS